MRCTYSHTVCIKEDMFDRRKKLFVKQFSYFFCILPSSWHSVDILYLRFHQLTLIVNTIIPTLLVASSNCRIFTHKIFIILDISPSDRQNRLKTLQYLISNFSFRFVLCNLFEQFNIVQSIIHKHLNYTSNSALLIERVDDIYYKFYDIWIQYSKYLRS